MGASSYNANARQLTYAGWCALGGAANPQLFSRQITNPRGEYLYTAYYLGLPL